MGNNQGCMETSAVQGWGGGCLTAACDKPEINSCGDRLQGNPNPKHLSTPWAPQGQDASVQAENNYLCKVSNSRKSNADTVHEDLGRALGCQELGSNWWWHLESMAVRKAELELDDLSGGPEAVNTNPVSPGPQEL